MVNKLDILAFGAHPDDVELGCGGTLIASVQQGKKIGVIDLTLGEMGTRGTVAERREEAKEAATILGAAIRENLELPDGFFVNDKEAQLKIIEAIRKYQPEIVLCNAPEDRHPDHGRAAQLVADASFLSGLAKVQTIIDGKAQKAWRPKYVFHYIQSRFLQPDFVFDISKQMELKMQTVLAHKTQFFDPNSTEANTFISSYSFLEFVKGRAKEYGQQIGAEYAEGFISKKMLGIHSFDQFILQTT
jgi:bacillithiol biosynthesis deacetylase BshB1